MAGQDTLMKALTHSLSGGALEVLGVYDVELAESIPTELPANTLRIDRSWRRTDGSIFHLEFQSNRESTLYRFLEYDVRLARQYETTLRTVVLYHSDVVSAPSELDIGTAQYRVENVYLSTLQGDVALDDVERHLRNGEWEPGDRIRLGLALAMHVEHPSQSFERVLRLIPEVPDETERDLVVGTMLALGEHALSAEQRIQLQKELRLVSKIAEELYQEGLQEGLQKGLQEGRQEGLQEGRQEGLATVAERMFRKGASLADVVDMTGLSPAEAKAIQDKLVH